MGSVVLVWDGHEHISINFFTVEESIGTPEKLIDTFLKHSMHKMKVGLRDDQPRGINHVINFPSDIVSPKRAPPKYGENHGRKKPRKMKKLPNGEFVPYEKD